MNRIFGMPVIEATLVPKMQLSKDCPVTDDVRANINAWMREFFGYTSIVPEDTIYVIGGSHLVMRPEMAARIAFATK